MIPIKYIREIELGPRQMTFGFDDQIRNHMHLVYNAVQIMCESHGEATIDGLLACPERPSGISESQLLQSLFWLAEELKIHFRISNRPVSPKQTKDVLMEQPQTSVSVLLSRQADETVFETAKKIGRGLLPDIRHDISQYEFSKTMVRVFENWQSSLKSCFVEAHAPHFPGRKAINNSLNLLASLLFSKDSYSVINNCVKYGAQLTKQAETIEHVIAFYRRDMEFWHELVDRMAEFKENLPLLKENPSVYRQYERLNEIMRLNAPYVHIEEARAAFESVMRCHLEIEKKKLDVFREKAVLESEKMIKKLIGLFDTFEMASEYRNEILRNFRTIRKKIEISSSMDQINKLKADAKDLFLDVLEEI